MANKRTVGVILSGGIGKRFGGDVPKQYQTISGREVFSYVAEAFKNCSLITDTVIAANKSETERLSQKYGLPAVEGGAERNQTVAAALSYIERTGGAEYVVFADAARPLITSKALQEIVELLFSHDGVITAAHITDSLGKAGSGVIDRSLYYLIQTPEAFKYSLLKNFDPLSDKTALVQQIDSKDIVLYYGLKHNFKITYPGDLEAAEALLKANDKKCPGEAK